MRWVMFALCAAAAGWLQGCCGQLACVSSLSVHGFYFDYETGHPPIDIRVCGPEECVTARLAGGELDPTCEVIEGDAWCDPQTYYDSIQFDVSVSGPPRDGAEYRFTVTAEDGRVLLDSSHEISVDEYYANGEACGGACYGAFEDLGTIRL